MSSIEENQLSFIPGARVIVHDINTVELRTGVWNCSSITLSDDEQKGVLGRVVLGLLNGQSLSTIAKEVDVRPEQIGSVIEALTANNVLIPSERRKTWNQLAYLATPTLGYRPEVDDRPSQVILLGSPTLQDQFTAISQNLIGEKIQRETKETLEHLRRQDLAMESDGLQQADLIGSFQHWKNALVIALWHELDPILLGNINRLAHQIGFAFLPGVIDGPFAIVGPTVIPDITACFTCAEKRVLEALRDHTIYTEYRQALAAKLVYGGSSIEEELNPFQANMVSFVAWDAINMVTLGNAFTLNKILTIYAPTLEVTFHDLLRMPGCNVCGIPPALDPTLYSDLRSYLSSQLGQ